MSICPAVAALPIHEQRRYYLPCSSDFPPPLSEPVRENLTHNPHVKFFEGTKRGYCRHALTDKLWTTWIRTLDTVEHPDARVSTLTEHVVDPR